MGKNDMVIDERLFSFIQSFEPPYPDYLYALRREALENDVPIVREDMQGLLRFLMQTRKPESILEVGTAVGFSALLMGEYAPKNCHITTIEKYEKRIPVARENFRKAGMEDTITLLEGDACEILGSLQEQFDFIFMDAAKGQYIHFLPDVKRLLAPGGALVSDNVLQDGEILESRYAVTRRNRTIHSRMREYLYALKHDPDLSTVILPVGDGVTISIKR